MARLHSADPLAPGQRIGPFLLLQPLGSGGSGRVWAVARAGQLGFAKRMVLKVMRQDKLSSMRARQRFDREARLGAQLRHANLRAVHELGSHEGRPYMALSWVDTSLEELLEHTPGKRLEWSVACWVGIQICAALAAAHTHVNHDGQPSPIVHADVAPGNILLTALGHVLLADLAATVDPSPWGSEQTPPEQHFFGNLGYASPEALRGEPLDGRADVFSLGCVLYELLAGAPPFEGEDERSIMFQVLEAGPVALERRAPDLPSELFRVVQRALNRSVSERFQSAEELRAALIRCVELSPFVLEQRAAAVIQVALGERIRQREAAMHQAYERFTPSRFERTDTLPIVAAQGAGSATLVARAAPGQADRAVESRQPQATAVATSRLTVSALLRRWRWGRSAFGAAALLLAMLVAWQLATSVREQPLGALPSSTSASLVARVSEATPSESLARPAPPPAPSDAAVVTAPPRGRVETSPAQPLRAPAPKGRSRGQRLSPEAPGAVSKPFQWNYDEDNPYVSFPAPTKLPPVRARKPAASKPAAPKPAASKPAASVKQQAPVMASEFP